MGNQSYFFLLGSNLGNRAKQLTDASEKIAQLIGSIDKSSCVYQTAAWGKPDQADFLNQVLLVKSDLKPLEALALVQSVELEMGRQRTIKWGERTIDIDILYVSDLVLHSPELEIPHPEIQNRKFTLVPLAEIAPDFVHPILKKSNADLLAICKDNLGVTVFVDENQR
jgi:2-amino-4-hydroxy-6-hydroxymethyldihydropteridine diphosphokinase